MDISDVHALTAQVLWAVFILSALFGVVARQWHFCTMGAVADIFNMGDWSRMRTWWAAMAVAILGFNLMVGAGWIQAANTIYAAPRILWLSHLLGGVLFGLGMVWASGCGAKTLIRVGGGSLKSLVVFVVMGVFAYAAMKGALAVLRVATVDRVSVEWGQAQDLPTLLAPLASVGVPHLAAWLGGLVALVLMLQVLRRPEGRRLEVWLPGLLIGGVIVAAWWVSGVWGHVAEHPETLEETFLATNSQRMESLTFTAPVAYVLDLWMLYSDKSKTLTLGIVSVMGVVLGSWVHALSTRSFRWEGFGGVEDTAWHLIGAALMGAGGVLAMGCTVGQGLSGLSTLSLGSILTLAGLMAGSILGLKVQAWRAGL
jgi:uncharacterized protein